MSADEGFLRNVIEALASALAPLASAAASPEQLAALLARLGWPAPTGTEVAARLSGAAAAINHLADDLDTGAGAATLVLDVSDTMSALAALRNVSLGSSAGAPFNDPAFWRRLPNELLALLVSATLEAGAPGLYGVLSFLGVLRKRSVAADPSSGRNAYVARTMDWTVLGRTAASPRTWLADVYGWGANFDHVGFLESLAALGGGIGGAVALLPPHPALLAPFVAPDNPDRGRMKQLAVLPFVSGSPTPAVMVKPALIVTALPPAGSPSLPPEGLLLSPVITGAAKARIGLRGGATLALTGDFQTSPLRVGLRPDGVTLEGSQASVDVAAQIDIAPATPVILGGVPDGTRFELARAHLGLTVKGSTADLEVAIDVGLDEASAVLDLGGADSFLRGVLGDGQSSLSLAAGLAWSSISGLTFSGSPQPSLTIPTNIRIAGVLSVTEIQVELGQADADAARLTVSVVGGLELGPFSVIVEHMGLQVIAAPATLDAPGNFALLDLAFGFKSPTSLGFALDLEGIVTGGGFVSHDPELGRYSGALAIDFLAVGLAAVVVVDTRLPGNPDGWALFASVSATFPSLPLGFGFFLSGVGGIVCLNRTMDTEALATGLREGAIDALLFPDNVFRDASLIISQLDAWFPQAEGSTVFGVAVTITWGTPKALVTGELGVMLSFPDLDLALVGSISMALPDEEHALLELHMDTLGALDVSEVTVMVVASLYDSSLLRTIQLSGDMAMYGRFGASPYFLLSVGGYHPNFQPPGYLPASVTELRRVGYELALSEDVWFGLNGYVAVTSNSLQFGAQAVLEASARYLGVTYTATGSVGFDVLLVFSPFSFAADIYASVSVSAGDREVVTASLTAHLEGPQPWYVSGSARFEFLGIGVRFNVMVGGKVGVQAPPRASVLDAVVAALAEPEAWRPVAPPGPTVLLASDNEANDGIVRVRPDAELEAVQTAAPLERTMDVYGAYAIEGPKTLHIEGAGIVDAAGVTWEVVADWFAPAMYDQLSRVEKIAAPSYEQMSAGVRLRAGGVSFGNDTQRVTPDYEVRVLNEDTTRPLSRQPLLGTLASVTAGLVLNPTRRQGVSRAVTLPQRFAVAAPSWTLIDAETGAPTGAPASYRAVLGQLHNRTGKDPTARSRLRIAPAHATREAI